VIKEAVMTTRRYRLNSRGPKQGMLSTYVQTQAINRKASLRGKKLMWRHRLLMGMPYLKEGSNLYFIN
jgi:hypothetical protein